MSKRSQIQGVVVLALLITGTVICKRLGLSDAFLLAFYTATIVVAAFVFLHFNDRADARREQALTRYATLKGYRFRPGTEADLAALRKGSEYLGQNLPAAIGSTTYVPRLIIGNESEIGFWLADIEVYNVEQPAELRSLIHLWSTKDGAVDVLSDPGEWVPVERLDSFIQDGLALFRSLDTSAGKER